MVIDRTEMGVRQGIPMQAPDGSLLISRNEAMVPNIVVVAGFIDLFYIVPVDDTHFVTFMLWRSKYEGERSNSEELHFGKSWWEMSEEEHRASPGDFEAQSSIGTLPTHSREHLSPGDRALGMLRRRLEEAVRDVAEGRDPPNLVFSEDAPPLQTVAHTLIPYDAVSAG